MAQSITSKTLEDENRAFAGTRGISRENWGLRFIPGFLDQETGSVYVSCGNDGCPAPVHRLDGLPEHLVLNRDPSGQVAAIKGSVVAGFIRDGYFYTREQAAHVGE